MKTQLHQRTAVLRSRLSALSFILLLLAALSSQLSTRATAAQAIKDLTLLGTTTDSSTSNASGAHTFLSGASATFNAGSTLAINGVLNAAPTSGTINLASATVTLPASVSGGTSSLQPLDSDLTAIAALTTNSAGRSLLTLSAVPTGALVGTSDTQTLTGKTISGGSNTLSNIANASLTNSAITIGGTSTSLGGSITLDTIDNALAANGLIARTAANTRAARTITGTASQITVTNGDGVSGNPTLAIATNPTLPGNVTVAANLTASGSAHTIAGAAVTSPTLTIYGNSNAVTANSTAPNRLILRDSGTDGGASTWSTTQPWGSVDFMSDDLSGVGGTNPVRARIGVVATNASHSNSDVVITTENTEKLRISGASTTITNNLTVSGVSGITLSGTSSLAPTKLTFTDGGTAIIDAGNAPLAIKRSNGSANGVVAVYDSTNNPAIRLTATGTNAGSITNGNGGTTYQSWDASGNAGIIGNLTVSGTGTTQSAGGWGRTKSANGTTASPVEDKAYYYAANPADTLAGIYFRNSLTDNSKVWLTLKATNASNVTATALTVDDAGTTVAGNLTVSGTGNNTFAGPLLGTRTTNSGSVAATSVFNGQVTGDANPRFTILASGQHEWGDGTGARDVFMARSGTGTLGVTGNLTVSGVVADIFSVYRNQTLGTSAGIAQLYSGNNGSGTQKTWVRTSAQTTNVTAASEAADFQVEAISAGSLTTVLKAGPSGTQILGTSAVKGIRTATASLDFPSTAASGGVQDLTVTVTGAAVLDSVNVVANGGFPPTGCIVLGSVTSANTVTVRLINPTGSAVDPGATTYRVTVMSF